MDQRVRPGFVQPAARVLVAQHSLADASQTGASVLARVSVQGGLCDRSDRSDVAFQDFAHLALRVNPVEYRQEARPVNVTPPQ